MNETMTESQMATKMNPASPPTQPNLFDLSALKAAMVMGPASKSEVKITSPDPVNTFSPSTTTILTTADTTSTPLTTTISSCSGKPIITTTVTIKSSNIVVTPPITTTSSSSAMDPPRHQVILNPRTSQPSSSITTTTTSNAGASIGNLIAGMDTIRQEAINSDKEIGSTASAASVNPVGKDVSTVIGRIEQGKGMTGPGTRIPTYGDVGGGTPASGSHPPIPRSRVKVEPPPRTATESGSGGVEAAATPKTQKSQRVARATSARAPSHRVTSSVSTTSAEGKAQRDPQSTVTRPSTSIGPRVRQLQNQVKSTRSYSAIKTHPDKMGDAAAGDAASTEKPTLKDQFAAFSRFGDTSSDGKQISLTNSDKWMKQAGVFGPKSITTTDTSIYFKRTARTAKKISFDDYKKFLDDLATSKKIEVTEIQDKMTNCGHPALSSATRAAHAGVVERLTDTSKYTGSHKERFDSTGKGRGIEGRRETKDKSGYTAAFKSKLGTETKNGSNSTSPTPPTK